MRCKRCGEFVKTFENDKYFKIEFVDVQAHDQCAKCEAEGAIWLIVTTKYGRRLGEPLALRIMEAMQDHMRNVGHLDPKCQTYKLVLGELSVKIYDIKRRWCVMVSTF